MFRRFFLVLIWLACQSATEAGETYYVSSSGRSLISAVRKASPGDTILIRGGTYIMGELLIKRGQGMGGAPGRYLTIKAYPGEKPILRPGKRRLIINADYIRIEGLHFIMPWNCAGFGKGLQIVNNRFTGPQPKFGAINLGGSDILIEGNHIEYDVSSGSTLDHGMYIHKGRRITVRNNTVLNSTGYGIHVYDEHKSTNKADWAAHPFVIKDYIIEGNFVGRSRQRSGLIIAKGRGGKYITIDNIVIRNNLFVGNAAFGLFIREGKNIKVHNNTFFRNRTASLLIQPSAHAAPSSNITIKNNIFVDRFHVTNKSSGENIILENNLYNDDPRLKGISDANPIVNDPKFVNPKTYDFSLQDSSPAIDAGVDIGLPFNGTAPDLGAFEFGNSQIAPNLSSIKKDYHIRSVSPLRDIPQTPMAVSMRDEALTKDKSAANGTFVFFRAFVAGNSIILDWQIAGDAKHRGFEVEWGENKNKFTSIGFVRIQRASNQRQSYQFVDQGLKSGIYYYRLKLVQLDGSFEYSSVIEITKS